MKANNIFLLIVGAILVYIGYNFKKKEEALKGAAVEIGLNMAKDEIVKDADVTKQWWNSMNNYWKQVWS